MIIKPSTAQADRQMEQAMAPLLAMYPPDDLPDAQVLQAMALRVGLWALVQSAGDLATHYGYERFRVRIMNAESVSARWQLELCLTAQDTHNAAAVVDAFNYGGETDLDEALLKWRVQQAIQASVVLPDAFRATVVDQWLDPQRMDALRGVILGAPAVALWRAQASEDLGEQGADAPRTRRPRARA